MEGWLRPIYDAAGMRSIDGWAIAERGVPSLELMEAAGLAVARAVEGLAPQGPVRVVCGKGNNGGDGLVAARYLAEWGFDVEALLLWPAADLSPDAAANLERFTGASVQSPADPATALAGSGAVVDAVFGTGFEGAPRDPAAAAIEAMNACAAPVVVADVASGVNASTGEVEGAAVQAAVTVALHAPKVGHYVAPGKWRAGEVRLAPIGIPDGAEVAPAAGLIGDGVLAGAPPRDVRSTKFSSGEVLVVGGSRGLTGAVCLTAMAAIRTGAGYATVAVPADLEPIFEVKLTEVMSRGLPSDDGNLTIEALEDAVDACGRARCVVLGPGLGHSEPAQELARLLAGRIEGPLVVDAGGLNAHAGKLGELTARAAPTVITPHGGELARLLGIDSGEVSAHRLTCAERAAERSGAIVLLKGDDTIVVDPGSGALAINDLPSPGLATAGTGDALAGMIGALIARGVEPFTAACAAARVHARAGRIAADRLGAPESVIAGDVVDAIPAALVAG